MARTHLLKLSSAALARDSSLHSKAQRWWGREHAEGDAVRGDAGVRRAAEREGLGYDEGGELAKRGGEFVRGLAKAYEPTPNL
jgi:hypothetical protein